MSHAHLRLFVLALLLVCAGGLASQDARTARSSDAQLAGAPANAAARKNPFEGRPDAVRAGQKLFQRHCAGCHGQDARGKGKAPDLHSPVVQNASPGALSWFLKNGNLKAGMPSWSRLPDQRLWQILAYLKTLD